MASGISELRIEKVGNAIALVRMQDGEVRSEFILSHGEVQGLASLWPELARQSAPAAAMMAGPSAAHPLQ